jgi:hypothetical protein
MISQSEGLTSIYNRFHDPDDRTPNIVSLRELHAGMDCAVLDAYGWSDIHPKCEFLLDCENDEEARGKKKVPWRHRWPNDIRDEVLARLLKLNSERAEEETRSGAAAVRKGAKKLAGKRTSKRTEIEDLFS